MSEKAFLRVCAGVFLVVAVAHLTRLVAGWEIRIAGWSVPRWISIPGLVIPALLSVWGFALAGRRSA